MIENWHILKRDEWPKWVINAAHNKVKPRKRRTQTKLTGRSFEYRVTLGPSTLSMNGHEAAVFSVLRVERRSKRKRQ